MRLNENQVQTIENKTGLTPISDEAASDSGLAGHFGDNTFYLDSRGVYVFEEIQPVDESGAPVGEANGDMVTAIQIAAVEPAEGDAVTVRSIQPEATQLTIELA